MAVLALASIRKDASQAERTGHADGERADQRERAKAQLGHDVGGRARAHRALHHRDRLYLRRGRKQTAERTLGRHRDALPERVRMRRPPQRRHLRQAQ